MGSAARPVAIVPLAPGSPRGEEVTRDVLEHLADVRVRLAAEGVACRTCGELLTPEHAHRENYSAREWNASSVDEGL
jgi:hypothetical protein